MATKPKTTAALPSGIRELKWMRADELPANPRNWRRHPKRQLDALDASLKANGWAGALLYNESTGRLIDGHARKGRSGKQLVPVLVGNWSEEQEKRILATLDPISAMAETDTELLRKLTTELDAELQAATSKLDEESKAIFATINKELNSQAEAMDFGAPASFFPSDAESFPETAKKQSEDRAVLPGPYRLKARGEISWDEWNPDSGMLNIPALRTDRLGTIPEPIRTWIGRDTVPCDNYLLIFGSVAMQDMDANTLVCTYTDDGRFEKLWESPESYVGTMLSRGVTTVISPNFSIYDGSHLAVDVWQTYRARWLSRYMQEAGIKIVPDLMLGNLVQDQAWQWRFAGIPKGCPAVALQVQQHGEVAEETYYRQRHRQLLKALDLLQPESLLLYRGPSTPEWFTSKLPSSLHVVCCDTFMSGRTEAMKAVRAKKHTPGIV